MREYLVFFRKLKRALPDFVAGFDLVAHEDDGRPLIDFVPALLQLRQDLPDVKYFFHAGETSEWGPHGSTSEATRVCLFSLSLLPPTQCGQIGSSRRRTRTWWTP